MPILRIHLRPVSEGTTEAGAQTGGYGPISVVPWSTPPEGCADGYLTGYVDLPVTPVLVSVRTVGAMNSEWSNAIAVPEPGPNLAFSVLACVLIGIVRWGK